ncbi:MAG: H-NS family nucleoid-associated regulatory protein [Vicinamibacterales bacterium]
MTIDLETLEDAQLIALVARAGELLEERKLHRRNEALEQARATLEKAGLSVRDLVDGSKKSTAKKSTTVYRAGFRYRHPDDAALEWAGRGQKPNWLRSLERTHVKPVEVPADAGSEDRQSSSQPGVEHPRDRRESGVAGRA